MLDFTEARDECVAVASAGSYASYLHLAERASDQQLARLLIVFVLLSLIIDLLLMRRGVV